MTKALKPLITVEIMAHPTVRESTHHHQWREFVKSRPVGEQSRHYYVATTDKNFIHPAEEKSSGHYLPEAIHPHLLEAYLVNVGKMPHLKRGFLPWVKGHTRTNTYGIYSPVHTLPFKDSTVERVITYNTLPSYVEDRNRGEKIKDLLKEAHRVLKSGGKFEIHQTRSDPADAVVDFNAALNAVEELGLAFSSEVKPRHEVIRLFQKNSSGVSVESTGRSHYKALVLTKTG